MRRLEYFPIFFLEFAPNRGTDWLPISVHISLRDGGGRAVAVIPKKINWPLTDLLKLLYNNFKKGANQKLLEVI